MADHSISTQILKEGKFSGIFAGWGESRVVALKSFDSGELQVIADTHKPTEKPESVKTTTNGHQFAKLGPLFSVAIACCDLMGSCLYTAAVSTTNSGKVT